MPVESLQKQVCAHQGLFHEAPRRPSRRPAVGGAPTALLHF